MTANFEEQASALRVLLSANGPMDDDLLQTLQPDYWPTRQHVNKLCRDLVAQGRLKRIKPEGGKIQNCLPDQEPKSVDKAVVVAGNTIEPVKRDVLGPVNHLVVGIDMGSTDGYTAATVLKVESDGTATVLHSIVRKMPPDEPTIRDVNPRPQTEPNIQSIPGNPIVDAVERMLEHTPPQYTKFSTYTKPEGERDPVLDMDFSYIESRLAMYNEDMLDRLLHKEPEELAMFFARVPGLPAEFYETLWTPYANKQRGIPPFYDVTYRIERCNIDNCVGRRLIFEDGRKPYYADCDHGDE